WNRAQRRAAALRDRGCIAPGCTAPPAACQLHHNWHWTDGGPTDLDNGALLCGFHHRMVHRQGWAVTLAANGYPQLTPPASIDPDRRPRQHHRFRLTLLTGRNRP
ncbi:MAG: HNH endonuclease signature motif containing protein, partial [Actinomycetes bacterium]